MKFWRNCSIPILNKVKLAAVTLCRGVSVSELCFGTLTLGPLQKNLSPEAGGRLLHHAYAQGVTFFDTAELYGTYAHLRAGLAAHMGDIVIASKSYAADRKAMAKSVERARIELNRDYIDIFLLHEQESAHTMKGHREALDYLLTQREKGVVRAVGISTHHVAGVRAALASPDIDVIHPLINIAGIGIADGTREDMAECMRVAALNGKAIYAMKALAGGALFRQAEAALSYVRQLPGVKALAIGMGSIADIEANVAFFATGAFPPSYVADIDRGERRLLIEPWCEGCGDCVSHCRSGCLEVRGDKVEVDHSRCVLCGYCVAHCKGFFMKVI